MPMRRNVAAIRPEGIIRQRKLAMPNKANGHLRAVFAICAFSPIFACAQPTPSRPESLGFSSERLRWLHENMQREVDEKRLADVVTLLMRHGKFVEERCYGLKDLTSGVPMTEDTIFRIYSMTKPVTGVVMMMLYEEGKWHPSDPISKRARKFYEGSLA